MAKTTIASLSVENNALKSEIILLQQVISALEAKLEVAQEENDSYLVDSETRDLQEAVMKSELASIKSYVTRLDELVNQLVDGEGCSEAKLEILVEVKTEVPQVHTTTYVVDKDLQVTGIQWLLKKVGFSFLGGKDFITKFDLYTNLEKNWFAIIRKDNVKSWPEERLFIKTMIVKARDAGFKSNSWKNQGAWISFV